MAFPLHPLNIAQSTTISRLLQQKLNDILRWVKRRRPTDYHLHSFPVGALSSLNRNIASVDFLFGCARHPQADGSGTVVLCLIQWPVQDVVRHRFTPECEHVQKSTAG